MWFWWFDWIEVVLKSLNFFFHRLGCYFCVVLLNLWSILYRFTNENYLLLATSMNAYKGMYWSELFMLLYVSYFGWSSTVHALNDEFFIWFQLSLKFIDTEQFQRWFDLYICMEFASCITFNNYRSNFTCFNWLFMLS